MTAPAETRTDERDARRRGYVDLKSYGAIGDGRTVALIARDGGIDWLPLPNLDSPPVFARLLDAEHGGCFELAPTVPFSVERQYLPGTNVLRTTFTTDAGSASITDALVTGIAGRLPWVELVRRIDGIDGEVPFAWRVRPGTRLRTASPWVHDTVHGRVIRIGGVNVAVLGFEHGPGDGGTDELDGAFTTAEGSRHLLLLAATDEEPLHLPDPHRVDRSVDRTAEYWQAWSREFSYDGPWADAVQRSALVLKLLIFAPTGAIAAAATTSLPEAVRGGKNWDYRFAWVRDAAYTLTALTRFGLREENHAAIAWLLRTIRANGPEMHIFYTLEGEVAAGVQEHDSPGWRGIGPVVSGNPAADQMQLGVYGDLFGILRQYVEGGNLLDAETGRLLAAVADRACDAWRQRDSGMWELGTLQHYTSSKMGCWQALDAAIALSERGQIPGSADRWRAERDRIAEWIHENCWSEQAQAYTMFPGTDELDTSVLLHAPSGFDRGERMSKTIDAIIRELGHGVLLHRYSGADAQEFAFVPSGFWAAGALACVGRYEEAIARMDELIALGNDLGLYAEMMDPKDGASYGNLPQGLSHLALVNAAITIEQVTPQELLP
ncbi:glycoside hydrolase family 15 protein [Herbiconiux sp. SYSU D00978]|uniref:glycoside hydrolase family 15 protein n=1 Tax=Herbiconiux sp. SYSU D00978 TaxID=2812562 RepID=UPI001A9731EC|nr:glycoside hydrolase family 15 protein [Herbiconiux sp. SYSU D00978]